MNKYYTLVFAEGTDITKEEYQKMHYAYMEENYDRLAHEIVTSDEDPQNLICEIRLYEDKKAVDWVLNYFHDYDYNPTLIYIDGTKEEVIYQGDFINAI